VNGSVPRGSRLVLCALVLVVASVLAGASASVATVGGGGRPGGGGGGGGGGGALPGTTRPSGPVAAQVDRCALYASTSGFGADCAGGRTPGSLKKVLGEQTFPECRYEVLTEANDDGVPYDPAAHPDEAGQWFQVTCLKGIRPDGTGDFTRVTSVQWFPATDPPDPMTPEQEAAWNFIRSVYPAPMVAFGPAKLPRVLIPTYFWLGQGSGQQIDETVFDGVREVRMRARVDQIEVTSGAEGAATLTCPGAGMPYDHSVGVYLQPSTCRDQYERSSAIMPDQVYEGTIAADWVVEYQLTDGSWQRLGVFPQSDDFRTAVQEIQTVTQ
jgi:hypothetical protein